MLSLVNDTQLFKEILQTCMPKRCLYHTQTNVCTLLMRFMLQSNC